MTGPDSEVVRIAAEFMSSKGRFVRPDCVAETDPRLIEVVSFVKDRLTTHRQHEAQTAALVEELKLWRMLVKEGGVPRYTITPGAALNTIVTSTDRLLDHFEADRTLIEGKDESRG